MATDRYSDNHKIVVGGGAGTLTVDANLTSVSKLEISNDPLYSGDAILINSPEQIRWSMSGNPYCWQFQQNAVFNFYDNSSNYYDLDISSYDFRLSCQDDIYLRGGQGSSTNCTLWLSPNGDSSPSIEMQKSTNEITTVATNININAEHIMMMASDITMTVSPVLASRSVTIAVSPASFVPSGDSDADTTTITLHGAAKHEHSGLSGPHSYFAMPLPESIPNGSSIVSIGARLEKTGGDVAIEFGIRTKDLVDGSPESDISDDTFGFAASSDGEETKTRTYSIANIDRNRNAYTIWCNILHGSDTTLVYIHGLLITYTTNKLDNNE